MLSPRALVRGNPARAKFATENRENIFNMSAKWTSFCLGLKVLTDWSTGLEYINMCHLVGAEIY